MNVLTLFWIALAVVLGIGCMAQAMRAHSTRTALALWFLGTALIVGAASGVSAADIRVPETSARYRIAVERAAGEYFGIDAPVARIGAQIHQESLWNPQARSRYAWGLAQFTPSTAAWLPTVCPELGAFDPWDAGQSIRGAACYDAWLLARVDGATPCDAWAFALSAYNGGLGWVKRDKQRASASGADPLRWFGHVDAHTARAAWAFTENRSYVERILMRVEPAYIAAGWSGTAACGVTP